MIQKRMRLGLAREDVQMLGLLRENFRAVSMDCAVASKSLIAAVQGENVPALWVLADEARVRAETGARHRALGMMRWGKIPLLKLG